jgi:hypothetical protein
VEHKAPLQIVKDEIRRARTLLPLSVVGIRRKERLPGGTFSPANKPTASSSQSCQRTAGPDKVQSNRSRQESSDNETLSQYLAVQTGFLAHRVVAV